MDAYDYALPSMCLSLAIQGVLILAKVTAKEMNKKKGKVAFETNLSVAAPSLPPTDEKYDRCLHAK